MFVRGNGKRLLVLIGDATSQKKKGAFYNLITVGIVKQARNYENAKCLMEYLATAHMNEKINNRWSTFPISLHNRTHPFAYQNAHFKLFRGSCAKILVNYPNMDRIIKKKRRRSATDPTIEIVSDTN